jgi:cellobiose-specific phosphotransferase system component IIC
MTLDTAMMCIMPAMVCASRILLISVMVNEWSPMIPLA